MLKIGSYSFQSRLILGTGKFSNAQTQNKALEASGTEVITFAVRRLPLDDPNAPNFLDQVDLDKYYLLPNTAGAKTAKEAVRIARIAHAAGMCHMVKVEVIGDDKTLYPDPFETYKACEELLADGMTVLAYTSDDVILAKRLQELGVHAIMPAGSPIGSGLGIVNPFHLSLIIEQATVPVIVDAGIGSAADAALAMSLGADGVLLNSAVSGAKDPVKMAEAMKLAVIAGRLSFEAGRIPRKRYASASSPLEGLPL